MCCCWGVGVFLRVFANLTTRICDDISDAVYKITSICLCQTKPTTPTSIEPHTSAKEEFYKEIDRDSAERLLQDRQDGTFLIRPSYATDSVGTLSLVQDGRMFHLSIRRRRDGMLALGSRKNGEKTFQDIDSLINYHVSNYLVLLSDSRTFYTLLLPYTTRNLEMLKDL